jgi:hypothetical protein
MREEGREEQARVPSPPWTHFKSCAAARTSNAVLLVERTRIAFSIALSKHLWCTCDAGSVLLQISKYIS